MEGVTTGLLIFHPAPEPSKFCIRLSKSRNRRALLAPAPVVVSHGRSIRPSPRLVSAVSTNTASGSVVLPPALAQSIPGDRYSERFLDRNAVSGSDLSKCLFRPYPATPGRDPTSPGVFFSTTIAQPPRGSVDRELDRSEICCRSFA